MTYARVRLTPLAVLDSGPLPAELVGLSDEDLADLSAALDPCPPDYQGIGFWPGLRAGTPYDPETQRLSDHVDEVPDPATCTVVVTPLVVNLTPAELEARAAAAGALLQQQVADTVQQHLDAAVRTRGYDSMATCVTYAGEASVPRFQGEGRAARAWRSAVWDRCYAVLAEVLAGERAALTPAEMIAELPALVWPD